MIGQLENELLFINLICWSNLLKFLSFIGVVFISGVTGLTGMSNFVKNWVQTPLNREMDKTQVEIMGMYRQAKIFKKLEDTHQIEVIKYVPPFDFMCLSRKQVCMSTFPKKTKKNHFSSKGLMAFFYFHHLSFLGTSRAPPPTRIKWTKASLPLTKYYCKYRYNMNASV